MKKEIAVWGLKLGLLVKREVRVDGVKDWVRFLREGCFCQLGFERRVNKFEDDEDEDEDDEEEEKGLMKREEMEGLEMDRSIIKLV